MNIKKHIPNLFTLGNLSCGTLAILYAVSSDYEMVAILVVLGIVFDFFDGFAARILGVAGELGKQLDSLADAVTSGVVPGLVMYKMIYETTIENIDKGFLSKGILTPFSQNDYSMTWLSYFGLVLVLGAVYRLAKFNIDTRQSDSFIGLPTPAMSLFVISLPLVGMHSDINVIQALLKNSYFLIGVSLFLTYLMNAELPLLALKFKKYSWKGNEYRYVLILTSLVLLITVHFLAIPLIIIAYILLSLVENLQTSKD